MGDFELRGGYEMEKCIEYWHCEAKLTIYNQTVIGHWATSCYSFGGKYSYYPVNPVMMLMIRQRK